MSPADLRRIVVGASRPFQLRLRKCNWPIICRDPREWEVSPSGKFFTHTGPEASLTIAAEEIVEIGFLD